MPKMITEKKKAKPVSIALSDDLKSKASKIAFERGMSLSSYIRQALIKEIKR